LKQYIHEVSISFQRPPRHQLLLQNELLLFCLASITISLISSNYEVICVYHTLTSIHFAELILSLNFGSLFIQKCSCFLCPRAPFTIIPRALLIAIETTHRTTFPPLRQRHNNNSQTACSQLTNLVISVRLNS
jgi:hypothetical protein